MNLEDNRGARWWKFDFHAHTPADSLQRLTWVTVGYLNLEGLQLALIGAENELRK